MADLSAPLSLALLCILKHCYKITASGSSRSIPFKSKKQLLMDSPCSKSQIGDPHPSSVSFPTPEKPPENPTLVKLFLALDSSILLSKLRRSKPTFSNISKIIEHLTQRSFRYSHLAQLKHILPEAIEIKRVLIHDETTCCMKPDLHVTLNADAVEYNDKSIAESKRINLRKVYRARLAEFVKVYPLGAEVPEEPLPELFDGRKSNENFKVEVKSVSSLMEEMASIPAAKLFSSPSKVTSTLANVPSTPAKLGPRPAIVASTPPEFASTPVRLFSTSLAARPQKRSSAYTNPDDVSTRPPVKHVRRSLSYPEEEKAMDATDDEPIVQVPEEDVSRDDASTDPPLSLNFDSDTEDKKALDVTDDVGIDQVPEEDVSGNDEILSILADKLRQSIKEQEMKAIEDQNPAISQANRREKRIACLPKLFDVIHYLIQSIRRWVITKEELVHKIIAGHSDITDRKEVEEQLILMQELVPEWMSEKRSSCGDLLVCINKLASPQTIRSRLEEVTNQQMAQLLSN